MLPLYLLLVFGLLQLGQLGTALLVTNYGAATIARQLVKDSWSGSGLASLSSPYSTKFNDLLMAGMKNGTLEARRTKDGPLSPLSTVEVHACVEVTAFPFVGHLVANRLANGTVQGCAANMLLSFNTGNYAFVLHSQAMARMNYQP